MQDDDFDCRQKNRLRRLNLATQPAAEIDLRNVKVLRELLHSAQHQAGPMQRARVDARVLGRRQGAIRCRSGVLSHQRYRAAFSAHTQVAIFEDVLSLFGHRAVALSRA